MPEFLVNALPGLVLMLIAACLGAVAYRHNNTKQLREIQHQVVETYQAESESLTRQAAVQKEETQALRAELLECKAVLEGVRMALAKIGFEVEVSGNVVVLLDVGQPKRTRVVEVKLHETKDGTADK